MKLPKFIINWIDKKTDHIIASRKPDYIIGSPDTPYMKRWWIIPRNIIFNIYLHQIMRSDDDRALHDHPFSNISLIIKGGYVEHTIAQGGVHYKTKREAGNVIARLATKAHRLEVLPFQAEPAKTLFITGPRTRRWYFHCIEKGKIWWKDFVNPTSTGEIGRGCD